MNNNSNLKSLVGDFCEAYAQRDREETFSAWLANRLRQEMPDMEEGAEQKLVQDIMNAVSSYEEQMVELNETIDAGSSKEEWYAEQLSECCAEIGYENAGERISQMGTELTTSGIQLMQGLNGAQQYDIVQTDVEPPEWNPYSIKYELQEMGKKACFAGIAIAANAVRYREESGGEVTIKDAVKEAFQKDVVTDPQEVKAVVAGAVKVAAERRLEEALPSDTPIEDITDMAGMAVESSKTLFEAANGDISATEAVDRIGRFGVVTACRIGRRALQGYMMEIPVCGPVLVDVFGGLLEHMESPAFYENVYTVVHDAAVATWEGIKDYGKRAVEKVPLGIRKLIKQ